MTNLWSWLFDADDTQDEIMNWILWHRKASAATNKTTRLGVVSRLGNREHAL